MSAGAARPRQYAQECYRAVNPDPSAESIYIRSTCTSGRPTTWKPAEPPSASSMTTGSSAPTAAGRLIALRRHLRSWWEYVSETIMGSRSELARVPPEVPTSASGTWQATCVSAYYVACFLRCAVTCKSSPSGLGLLRASGFEFDHHNVMRRPGVVHRVVRDRLPHDDYLATANRSRSRASVWESKGKFAIGNANRYQTRMSVHN